MYVAVGRRPRRCRASRNGSSGRPRERRYAVAGRRQRRASRLGHGPRGRSTPRAWTPSDWVTVDDAGFRDDADRPAGRLEASLTTATHPWRRYRGDSQERSRDGSQATSHQARPRHRSRLARCAGACRRARREDPCATRIRRAGRTDRLPASDSARKCAPWRAVTGPRGWPAQRSAALPGRPSGVARACVRPHAGGPGLGAERTRPRIDPGENQKRACRG
jgi:hypothetical protein